jgi:hypothetical protein
MQGMNEPLDASRVEKIRQKDAPLEPNPRPES